MHNSSNGKSYYSSGCARKVWGANAENPQGQRRKPRGVGVKTVNAQDVYRYGGKGREKPNHKNAL